MLFEIIILTSAFPIGYLISWMARDELVAGREWFLLASILAAFFSVVFIILGIFCIGFTFAFIFIVSFLSYLKSFDAKWINYRKS